VALTHCLLKLFLEQCSASLIRIYHCSISLPEGKWLPQSVNIDVFKKLIKNTNQVKFT